MAPDRPDAEQVVRAYFHRLLTERDLDVCEDLLAEGYIDHDAPPDAPAGPAATRAYVATMLADYPDLRFEIHELISQGSTVALRATWHGTHRITERSLHQLGLVFLHVDKSGRLAERWSAYADVTAGADPGS